MTVRGSPCLAWDEVDRRPRPSAQKEVAAINDIEHHDVDPHEQQPAPPERVTPEDELAPWAAYLDIHEGDTSHGMALAMALRDEPLDLSAERASRVGDLVIHRLWLARIEFRTDPEARAVAEELLASGLAISPYRRAMLHYALGADVLTRTPLRRLEDLDDASEHLNHCLALARSLAVPLFVARCESMLALLEMPRGNLAVAEELCRSALGVEVPGPTLTFWQIRASVVLQWAQHYQGRPIDVDVLAACAEHPLIWSDPVLASQLAAVTALAAREARDLPRAWQALGRAQVDRRIAGSGSGACRCCWSTATCR